MSLTDVQTFLAQNSMLEYLIFIIMVIIIFTIVYSTGVNIMASIFQPSSPYLVKGMINGNNSLTIPQDPSQSGAIPLPRSTNEAQGIEFTWSIWINITDLDNQNGQYKHIFNKGDNNQMTSDKVFTPNNAPGLYIAPNTNELVVFMNTFSMIDQTITIPDIPLMSWINIIIRVEGSYFDAYINGVLVKRLILTGVPKQNNGSIYVAQNSGFHGYISDLRYFNEALQPGDILALVKRGPNITTSGTQTNSINQTSNLSMQWYLDKSI